MSTLGTIRNAMVTKITTLFPNKKRIPRPRVLDQNIDNFLNDGFGIYIGPSTISDQDLGYHMAVRSSEINIILTEKIYTLDNNYVGEAAAENSLHGNKESLIQSISEMTLEAIEDDFLNILYTSDDGGEFIFAEKNNYLALTITFTVNYSKNKTYCL
jgi:hypothetical protein